MIVLEYDPEATVLKYTFWAPAAGVTAIYERTPTGWTYVGNRPLYAIPEDVSTLLQTRHRLGDKSVSVYTVNDEIVTLEAME